MHPALFVPLAAGVIAAMLASAILARDSGQRANRLVAGILACASWWSLCEVVASLTPDADEAVRWMRLTSAGWVLLGPLGLALQLEIVAEHGRVPLRRLLPLGAAASALAVVVYATTPWGIRELVPTPWGWSLRFGPLFAAVYALTLVQVGLALAPWPGYFAGTVGGERRESLWLLGGIVVALLVATSTDVVAPLLGRPVPRLGSTSLLLIGCVAGWSVRRHGYLLVAPGALSREILEGLREGVALVRPDGSIGSANAGLARLLGRPAEKLPGARLEELFPALCERPHPEHGELESEVETPDGEVIPVSCSSSPLRDGVGGTVGRVLVVRDLREVALLRNHLVTSGRLAAVGELASGIAEEIAKPVSFLRSQLGQLRQHWESLAEAAAKADVEPELEESLAEAEELITDCVEGVERVAAIVRDVGTVSRDGAGDKELVDVNALIDSAISVARLSTPVVVERCYGDVPGVFGDPQQLKEVFLNLFLNAIQAVGGDGHIRITTQSRNGWVAARVEDDGPGIEPESIHRVFDPFFTTRPMGEGLGMGLAHCYQIVGSHGGDITAASLPGGGATFQVRLPVAF